MTVFHNGTLGRLFSLLVGGVFALASASASAQFGPILTGAGPINRSMGGASTAAPLSAGGALFWNPATLIGLKQSELDVGAELLFPHASMSSTFPANTFGPGFPATDASGRTNSQDDVFPLPTMAFSFHPEDSPFTFGLGAFAVAGFGLNYPGNANNPLQATPPAGLGFGPIFSQYSVMQIVPSLVYEVNDQFSISFSPLVDIGTAQLDPAVIAAPSGGRYPSGTHSSSAWGGGFMLGAFYQAEEWNFGASYKSTQWFQPYSFSATDSTGAPRTFQFTLDAPSIFSLGTSYQGFDRWIIAADVRYLDFQSTNGYDSSGFAPDGALRGLGYKNIYAIALGTQYQLTDALFLRLGYSWSGNPVPSGQTSSSAASPLIIQNILSAGASYQVSDALMLSLAYMHAFDNSSTGPIVLPGAGPIPGTSVTSTASADSVMVGATVKFGPSRR